MAEGKGGNVWLHRDPTGGFPDKNSISPGDGSDSLLDAREKAMGAYSTMIGQSYQRFPDVKKAGDELAAASITIYKSGTPVKHGHESAQLIVDYMDGAPFPSEEVHSEHPDALPFTELARIPWPNKAGHLTIDLDPAPFTPNADALIRFRTNLPADASADLAVAGFI